MTDAMPPRRDAGSDLSSDSARGRFRPSWGITGVAEFALRWTTVVVVASTALLAGFHLNDRFRIFDQVPGVWMALGRAASHGTLYPPLFDGERYGGTRYMPLSIELNGVLQRIVESPVLASKSLSALTSIVLIGVMFGVLRRFGLPRLAALALPMLVLVSDVGMTQVYGVRYDALPVALQLAALGLVAWGSGRWVIPAAAACCAFALMAKFSALWAPFAAAVWLWRSRPRDALRFVISYGTMMVALAAVFQVVSDGRMGTNLLELSGSGRQDDVVALLRTPLTVVHDLVASGQAVWAVSGLAVLGFAVSLARRTITVFHVAAVAAALITLIAYTDIGITTNHLLDVLVLLVILVGHLWASVAKEQVDNVLAGVVAPALLAFVLAGAFLAGPAEDVLDVAVAANGSSSDAWSRKPLARMMGPGTTILSDDPYLSVASGRQPVVLDAFMLLRLLRDNPHWKPSLLQRIQNADFDIVALIHNPAERDGFYDELYFGHEVLRAIEQSYRPEAKIDGYWVYVPR